VCPPSVCGELVVCVGGVGNCNVCVVGLQLQWWELNEVCEWNKPCCVCVWGVCVNRVWERVANVWGPTWGM